jgi:hypothetical protein
MYDVATVERALSLVESGSTYSQVSRITGASRTAIRDWQRDKAHALASRQRTGQCMRCAGYRFPIPHVTESAYSYLLGLYLGDGCLLKARRGVYRFNLSLDARYPIIRDEAQAATAIVMPSSKASVRRHPRQRLVWVNSLSKHWPCLFPQHGPGRKHDRPITLEDWQRAILDFYPWRFLRGLIHSDGSRHLNTIRHPKKTYRYPRYEFSNRSDDIRGLFGEYCDKVGVEWRPTNRWNISVARRDSVALMDRCIGPKR